MCSAKLTAVRGFIFDRRSDPISCCDQQKEQLVTGDAAGARAEPAGVRLLSCVITVTGVSRESGRWTPDGGDIFRTRGANQHSPILCLLSIALSLVDVLLSPQLFVVGLVL